MKLVEELAMQVIEDRTLLFELEKRIVKDV